MYWSTRFVLGGYPQFMLCFMNCSHYVHVLCTSLYGQNVCALFAVEDVHGHQVLVFKCWKGSACTICAHVSHRVSQPTAKELKPFPWCTITTPVFFVLYNSQTLVNILKCWSEISIYLGAMMSFEVPLVYMYVMRLCKKSVIFPHRLHQLTVIPSSTLSNVPKPHVQHGAIQYLSWLWNSTWVLSVAFEPWATPSVGWLCTNLLCTNVHLGSTSKYAWKCIWIHQAMLFYAVRNQIFLHRTVLKHQMSSDKYATMAFPLWPYFLEFRLIFLCKSEVTP